MSDGEEVPEAPDLKTEQRSQRSKTENTKSVVSSGAVHCHAVFGVHGACGGPRNDTTTRRHDVEKDHEEARRRF